MSAGEKTALCFHLLRKNAIILPREARDKHRKSAQKSAFFLHRVREAYNRRTRARTVDPAAGLSSGAVLAEEEVDQELDAMLTLVDVSKNMDK